jgi:hypothetical protein
MRTLRALAAAPFDERFLERSSLFAPVQRAARAVCDAARARGAEPEARGFPPVDTYGEVFGLTPAPVRFEAAAPRPRRRGHRREPIDVQALYDARITLERVVPTRPCSWHDFMNALVWGTFPKAKLALHARQHRAIAERIEPGARTLPPTRTRELDALALLDEGGVLLPSGAQGGDEAAVVFGHAIYESLALGVPPAVVAAIHLPAPVDSLDEALAVAIGDPRQLCSPEGLSRIELPLPAR